MVIGLKLLLQFGKNKVNVIGFDKDTKTKLIKENISPISYIKNLEIKKIKILSYEADYSKLNKCDAIILCLPTPLKNKKPDLSHIINTMKNY